jgi:hypothetical protein
MSWEDMMRRILPPVDGASPHVTSRYGERFNRPEGASNPHGGIDFNYEVGGQRGINLKHPDLRSPVDGVVENAGLGTSGRIAIRDRNGNLHEILHTLPPAAQRQFGELFGLWPPFSENPVSPDLSQARPGQSNTPNDEDWSAMWRRRIGLP